MIKKETKKIICPTCGKALTFNLFPAVNVTVNPELRDEIISGKFFNKRCPYCKKAFRLNQSLLYNDMDNRFMIYYIPEVESTELIDRKLEAEFSYLEPIVKRIVTDFKELKEKILIFENGLNDMAVELTKYAVSEVVYGKKKISVENGYFDLYDRESNTIGFTFYLDGNPYCQSTRLEVYDKSYGIIQEVAQKEKKRIGFLKIDRAWADNALFRYKRIKQKQKADDFFIENLD